MAWQESFQPTDAPKSSDGGWRSSFKEKPLTVSPAVKPVSRSSDILKSTASGLADTAMFPIDMGTYAGEFIGNKMNKAVGGEEVPYKSASEMLGIDYDPKTLAGKIIKPAVGFALPFAGALGNAAKAVPSLMASKKAISASEALASVAKDNLAKSSGKLVTEENAPLLQTAKDFKIPVFRSQVSKGAPTKLIGSMMKDVPLSGAGPRVENQIKQFHRGVLSTIGETGEAVTPEKLGSAYDRLSKNYTKLTGKYNIPVTPELDSKLLELSQNARVQLAGDPDKLSAFNKYWDLISDNMTAPAGVIKGKSYQQIRSGIGSTLRGKNGSPELGQLQNIIDEGFQSSMIPEDAKLFNDTRKQYRNMIALEKVVKSIPQGEAFSPTRLQGAVKQVFGDYAYGGDTDLERLSRLGTVLKDTFPSSGTSQRTVANEVYREIKKKGLGAIAGIIGGTPLSRYGAVPYLYQDITQSPYAINSLNNFLRTVK